MSIQYKMTITREFALRLAMCMREDEGYQDITLRALHLLTYGSPIEQELRAEIERLHDLLRRLAGGVVPPPPPPPQPTSEKELGW